VPLDIAKRLADALAVTLESLVGNGEAFRTPDPGGPEASETFGRGTESQP